MESLSTNPLLMRGLHALALGKAFLRYRNPRRQRSGRHQVEFHEQIWRQAATQLGATWTRLGGGISQITRDHVATRVAENMTAIDDPVTLAVLHNKPLTHRLLSAAGLAVPPHAVFTIADLTPALKFLRTAGANCVVKPAGGTGGGRGVTTGIRTPWQLARACAIAAVYDDQILIERQIEGHNYRLLFLDGKLLDSFRRLPPAVIGDGRSSIVRLVRLENDRRLQNRTEISQVLLTIDLDMRRTLAGQGLSLRSIPAAGQTVKLKSVVNENCGAQNSTANSLFCDSIICDCAEAARVVGARFVGIDLVTSDPARPLKETGGTILEMNGTPNLYYHYKKADGPFPVAVFLLRRLFDLAETPEAAPRLGDLETSRV